MPFQFTCLRCGRVSVDKNNGRQYCSISCSSKVIRRSNAERFWPKCDRSGGPTACWPWQRSTTSSGYGKFGWTDPETGVHQTLHAPRVAFFLTHGYWPQFACHSCDNPLCCNPAHIFDGTPADNMHDMWRKGRARPGRVPGKRNGRAKFAEADILAIRTRHAQGDISTYKLAEQYGVVPSTVRKIIVGIAWVDGPWPEGAGDGDDA